MTWSLFCHNYSSLPGPYLDEILALEALYGPLAMWIMDDGRVGVPQPNPYSAANDYSPGSWNLTYDPPGGSVGLHNQPSFLTDGRASWATTRDGSSAWVIGSGVLSMPAFQKTFTFSVLFKDYVAEAATATQLLTLTWGGSNNYQVYLQLYGNDFRLVTVDFNFGTTYHTIPGVITQSSNSVSQLVAVFDHKEGTGNYQLTLYINGVDVGGITAVRPFNPTENKTRLLFMASGVWENLTVQYGWLLGGIVPPVEIPKLQTVLLANLAP